MRIGRVVIIPAIAALGLAGPVMATYGMSLATAQAATVQVQATAASAVPGVYYHN